MTRNKKESKENFHKDERNLLKFKLSQYLKCIMVFQTFDFPNSETSQVTLCKFHSRETNISSSKANSILKYKQKLQKKKKN